MGLRRCWMDLDVEIRFNDQDQTVGKPEPAIAYARPVEVKTSDKEHLLNLQGVLCK